MYIEGYKYQIPLDMNIKFHQKYRPNNDQIYEPNTVCQANAVRKRNSSVYILWFEQIICFGEKQPKLRVSISAQFENI